MLKKHITKNISDVTGFEEDDVKYVVDEFIRQISDGIENGEDVKIRDLGTFLIKTRKAKNNFNIKTGKSEIMPEGRVIKFAPSLRMKNALNNN